MKRDEPEGIKDAASVSLPSLIGWPATRLFVYIILINICVALLLYLKEKTESYFYLALAIYFVYGLCHLVQEQRKRRAEDAKIRHANNEVGLLNQDGTINDSFPERQPSNNEGP